jgi:flagellar hook-associated protein 1 FlgK
MTNPFAAMNASLTGLHAQQRIAEIAGKNVANVNTEGYSRNRAELTEDTLISNARVFAVRDDVGGGVAVSDVIRIRDELAESRNLVEQGHSSYLDELKSTYDRLEGVITEPSDDGLAAQLNDFWNTWDDIGTDPTNLGARSALLAKGQSIATQFNQAAISITDLTRQTASATLTYVGEVNSTVKQIADLNHKIQGSLGSSGGALNDAMDQRDLMVERVSQLTGATRSVDSLGNVNLNINGITIVAGDIAVPLTAVASPANAVTVTDPQGNRVSITEGQIGAMITSTNTTYPSQLAQLDAVAQKLWTDVNAVHATGYGLGASAATNGRNFFDPPGGPVTALTLALSTQVAGNPDAVSAANTPNSIDGKIAHQIAALNNSVGGASALYQQLVARLGVNSSTAQNAAKLQAGVVAQVNEERKGVSGVNIDEEMVTISQANQAYAANARVISIIDEMLQTLVNLGR